VNRKVPLNDHVTRENFWKGDLRGYRDGGQEEQQDEQTELQRGLARCEFPGWLPGFRKYKFPKGERYQSWPYQVIRQELDTVLTRMQHFR
jgi:hypothetical protein